MPSYKLIYFNARGRTEFIRLLFAQAGVEFEDKRVDRPEWAQLKPTMPTGVLPVLEIDGQTLPESQAIARYVAREYNLAGSNNLEMAQCEVVMEIMIDIVTEILSLYKEKDEAKKIEMKKKIYEDKTKPKLKHIENILIANGGDVFVGKTITMADIAFLANVDFFRFVSDDPLKDFPKLIALKERVSKEPKIAAWLDKRPDTQY